MNTENFNKIIEDRLHNFKVAAEFQKVMPMTALALAGMVCKRAGSVCDLIREYEQGKEVSRAMWDEKIGDIINYLLLLTAFIADENDNRVQSVIEVAI